MINLYPKHQSFCITRDAVCVYVNTEGSYKSYSQFCILASQYAYYNNCQKLNYPALSYLMNGPYYREYRGTHSLMEDTTKLNTKHSQVPFCTSFKNVKVLSH